MGLLLRLPSDIGKDTSIHINDLSVDSVTRVAGEEDVVMERAEQAGHPIKTAIVLNVSEADVLKRWQEVAASSDRGFRKDDESPAVFQKRLDEFRKKTAPVLLHYRLMGKLIDVNGDLSRDAVFEDLIEKLYAYAVSHSEEN